jgi:hypothetical protein
MKKWSSTNLRRFLRPVLPFFEKLGVYNQKSKRFAVFLRLSGMVRPMRAQDGPRIPVVQLLEPLETAMNIYVVDEEIDQPVDRNADPHEKEPQMRRGRTQDVKQGAGNGENQKEAVVFFEKIAALIMGFVVVFVPVPQKSVHHILVRKPGDKLHERRSSNGDEGVKQDLHIAFEDLLG